MTVDCLFVCPCNSSEFCLSSVSSEVSKSVFCGQTHGFLSQGRNFGNVLYMRDLHRHALEAQIREVVSNSISLNDSRPAQPISLGDFEPFHDMMIFNLLEVGAMRYTALSGRVGTSSHSVLTCRSVILSLLYYLLFI